jgi:hypothetical protein
VISLAEVGLRSGEGRLLLGTSIAVAAERYVGTTPLDTINRAVL